MIFLSKNGEDEYVNMFAEGCKTPITHSETFKFRHSNDPIVLRGIMKHKVMKECWTVGRHFYYIDSGYFGNQKSPQNPQGWKYWHRIVKNDIQHGNVIIDRPGDRWSQFNIPLEPWKKGGSKILIAAPDEKPCIFYGITKEQWITETIDTLKQHTDRPIEVRERSPNRIDRIQNNTLKEALDDNVFALVTFNSNAATEAIMYGYPAFAMSPTHAAAPVALNDLSKIETPLYADNRYEWACHLAYGQFHVNELKSGMAMKILQGEI